MKELILLLILHLYNRSAKKLTINEDIDHWKEILGWQGDYEQLIKRLFIEKIEFRNLFYYRIGELLFVSRIIRFFFPPLPTLYLWTPHIGGGLFIQHGFATVVAAKSIGSHCFVNQQVTIGYNGLYAPIIGDNVMVTCGAKVLGNVKVGNNVIIGANAVVVKDVPDNATVVGVPAKIVKINGVRV